MVLNDRFAYGGAEFGHPFGKPWRHSSAVQRKVRGSGALHALDPIAISSRGKLGDLPVCGILVVILVAATLSFRIGFSKRFERSEAVERFEQLEPGGV